MVGRGDQAFYPMRFVSCSDPARDPGHDFGERRGRRAAPENKIMQPGVAEPRDALGPADQTAKMEDAKRVASTRVVGIVTADERSAMRKQLCCALMVYRLQIPRGVAWTRFCRPTEFRHLSLREDKKTAAAIARRSS